MAFVTILYRDEHDKQQVETIEREEDVRRVYPEGCWIGGKIDLTAEQALTWLEDRLARDNSHSDAGLYRRLYEIVVKHGGHEVARAVLQEIAEEGGLLA